MYCREVFATDFVIWGRFLGYIAGAHKSKGTLFPGSTYLCNGRIVPGTECVGRILQARERADRSGTDSWIAGAGWEK
jgi:hypothetical protein